MIVTPRYAHIWLPGYTKDRIRAWRRSPVTRLWLMFADHFEPLWKNATEQLAFERVANWTKHWPAICSRFHDADGREPRYTFFYPEEEYRPGLLEALEPMVTRGIADVEIHLHHDGESRQSFLDRIKIFAETLSNRHGLLRRTNGRIVFGFIHGLWALDNSRPDGRFCGLNNEISLLRDLGCYADFTMPSGPSPTQARLLNTIYWAVDDPMKPKSYDTGFPLTPGGIASGDLLMIPGPFGLRWRGRLLPRLETGELASYNPPNADRVCRWIDLAPRIGGDAFLKLHTHGAQERHTTMLLNGGLAQTLGLITDECRKRGCSLRFASAWEIRRAIDAAVGAPTPRGDALLHHQGVAGD